MTDPGALARTVTIVNLRGLHARAAAKFVKTAGQYDAQITVARQDNEVSGLSIMGLMMLAAGKGSEIEIRAAGNQAQAALDALTALIAAKFDED
jgi:phosphocarrier protein HPr